jgi:hypothetical protein
MPACWNTTGVPNSTTTHKLAGKLR